MKVFDGSNFKVYVYKDHYPPHCHVVFSDGSEIVVDLLNLEPMYGGKLDKKMRKTLLNNFKVLMDVWQQLNQ